MLDICAGRVDYILARLNQIGLSARKMEEDGPGIIKYGITPNGGNLLVAKVERLTMLPGYMKLFNQTVPEVRGLGEKLMALYRESHRELVCKVTCDRCVSISGP